MKQPKNNQQQTLATKAEQTKDPVLKREIEKKIKILEAGKPVKK